MTLFVREVVPDLLEQNRLWGANCGPSALAAILGMTAAEVRPIVERVQGGRFLNYMNAGHLTDALRQVGREVWRVECLRGQVRWPSARGLCVIQFDGPWCEPGVPVKARYRYTHIVASIRGGALIYDGNANRWLPMQEWKDKIMPVLQRDVKRSTGWYTFTVLDVIE
jgi:hypothetical protein